MNSMLVAITCFEWQRRWKITAASLVDTTDLSWNLLPLLPPYLYAPLAMKPCSRSCEMFLAGKIRRAASHSAWLSPRWEFESCICSCGGIWLQGRGPVNGLRVTRDLFLRYVVWIKTICCCIADACACRTLTAMARVPVRAARSRHDCCQGFRVRWKRTMICWVLSSAYFWSKAAWLRWCLLQKVTVSDRCQAKKKNMVKKRHMKNSSLWRNWGMRIRTGWVHGLLDVSCHVQYCLLHTVTMCLCMIDWRPAWVSYLWFDVLAAVCSDGFQG